LLTAGQHDQSFTATEPILWAELPPIAQPFVKWSTEVRRLEDLPRVVRRATKTALAHPTGPVFLSLPVDVLNAERDLELGAASRVAPRFVGDRAAVDRAAALLAKAERPLLVVGDAVAHADALAEMVELAELVARAGKEVGLQVTIDHVDNPRIEAESHYYRAANTHLLDLGLRPRYLSETLIESVFDVIRRYRDRVITEHILPRTRWRPAERQPAPS